MKLSYYLPPVNLQDTCLQCGNELGPYGRTDRKFCSEKCRKRYHNKASNHSRYVIHKKMNVLLTNYDILDTFVKNGMTRVAVSLAVSAGFDLSSMTGMHKEGRVAVYECFDILYMLSSDAIYGMARKKRGTSIRKND